MVLRFLGFDPAKPDDLFHERMVLGYLAYLLIDQVETAVSHVGKIQCIANNRCHHQCRPHTFQLDVRRCSFDQFIIRNTDNIAQNLFGFVQGSILQFFPQDSYRIFGRKIPRLVTAHPVGYRKKVRKRPDRLIRHIYIILVDLTLSSHISHCIYLHLFLPVCGRSPRHNVCGADRRLRLYQSLFPFL